MHQPPARAVTEGPSNLAVEIAGHLVDALGRVTMDEYRDQEAQFDEQSQHGLELLHLMADNQWMRGTHEEVRLFAANSIETTIRVHADLSKVRHEAIRDRPGPIWLPLTVLPAPTPASQPEDFEVQPSPTVLDASGDDLHSLPQTHARRWLAPALAQIMTQQRPQGATDDVLRESMVLLTAAVYRTLRNGMPQTGATASRDALGPTPDHDGERTSGIHRARQFLQERYQPLSEHRTGKGEDARSVLMFERVAKIIHALRTPTTIVVIPVDAATGPAEFSIRLPSRHLDRGPRRWWRSRCLITPRAQLDLGIVLPSPEADREITVHLPEGVSFVGNGAPVSAQVATARPSTQRRLGELLDQIVGCPGSRMHDAPVIACLCDLAIRHLDLLLECYPYHQGSPLPGPAGSADPFLLWARDLRPHLVALTTVPDNEDALKGVKQGQDKLRSDGSAMFRVVQARRVDPVTAHVRVPVVEDRAARTTPLPGAARVFLQVMATQSSSLYAARYAGYLNLALLSLVIVLFQVFGTGFDNQVLGAVLTLFATIQASRVQQPDRSTLRGLLASAGSWLGAASVLPTVLLGVAMAFSDGRQAQVPLWALAAAVTQAVVVLVLSSGLMTGSVPRRGRARMVLKSDPSLDHARVDVLHTDWWRTTTAAALMQGRAAFAYAVCQERGDLTALVRPTDEAPAPLSVRSLLTGRTPSEKSGPQDLANILALLSMSAGQGSLSMLVFREQPRKDWQERHRAQAVRLDSERLIAHESDIGVIDIYLGLDRDRAPALSQHPLHRVLRRADEDQRAVLEIQLPSPPPAGGCPSRSWMRIRIGLRNREINSLAQFLADIKAGVSTSPGTELLIDVSTQSPARWFIGEPDPQAPRTSRRLTAQDLDVIGPALARSPHRPWCILGFTAPASGSSEREVLERLQRLRPELQVASLFTALMHGLTVIFVLAQDLPDHQMLDKADFPDAQLLVAHCIPALSQTTDSTGVLLQLDVTSSDRHGLLDRILADLQQELSDILEVAPARTAPTVLYGFNQVADGRRAASRLMIRLPVDVCDTEQFRQDLRHVERSLRMSIINLPASPISPGSRTPSWQQARPVVSLRLAELEAAQQQTNPPSPSSPTEG